MALDPQTLGEFLDTIARFVRERLVPAEAEVAETDAVPPAVVAEMRRLGLFGMTIPEAHGGPGPGVREEAPGVFGLCQTPPAFRSGDGTNNGTGRQGIGIHGPGGP